VPKNFPIYVITLLLPVPEISAYQYASSLFLKLFTDEACTTVAGKLFHKLTILHVKKCLLI